MILVFFCNQRSMLWKKRCLLVVFFTAENTKILFKIALKNTEFAKLNEDKAFELLLYKS